MKGFRVTPATQLGIQRWISARDEGLDGDLALPAGLDVAPKQDVKLNQVGYSTSYALQCCLVFYGAILTV